jgi:release factor glutamine methyltransferase
MRVVDALTDASARLLQTLALDRAVARLEARVLAAHAWQVVPSWLLAHDTDSLDAAQIEIFKPLLERRLRGEPIAYITGTREFYGREFQVTPDVLIPRPETELLVELALAEMAPERVLDVLDLGTGSGCVAITLAHERPHARIVAVDRSRAALDIASLNADRLGVKVEFVASDWFAALECRNFDLIVGNPPYVADSDAHLEQGDLRYEPRSALASGLLGLDDCARIIDSARAHLRSGGRLLLEHGHDQSGSVRAEFERRGYASVASWRDHAGIERVSGGKVSDLFTQTTSVVAAPWGLWLESTSPYSQNARLETCL